MNRLIQVGESCADGIGLLRGTAGAVVTFVTFANDCTLTNVTRAATLDQRDVSSETKPVDMPPSLQVIQGITDKIELLEKRDAETTVLDITDEASNFGGRKHAVNRFGGFLRFRLAYMVLAKEKLAVEIGDVNGVKIDEGDGAEAGGGKIFHKLTSDTAGTDDEDLGLGNA